MIHLRLHTPNPRCSTIELFFFVNNAADCIVVEGTKNSDYSQFYRKGHLNKLNMSHLSIFLLFALRRATMPSLARESRENGSIPYTTEKTFVYIFFMK